MRVTSDMALTKASHQRQRHKTWETAKGDSRQRAVESKLCRRRVQFAILGRTRITHPLDLSATKRSKVIIPVHHRPKAACTRVSVHFSKAKQNEPAGGPQATRRLPRACCSCLVAGTSGYFRLYRPAPYPLREPICLPPR